MGIALRFGSVVDGAQAMQLSASSYQRSTHPRESHLLPLVERLVEMYERGADRGGGRAHGGKPLAHRLHAAARGERGAGGGGGGRRFCGTVQVWGAGSQRRY